MVTLTKRADQILKLARQIAREYGLGYVGTEHVLLAIVREGTGLGAAILLERGVSEAQIQAEIATLLQKRMHETWVLGRLPGTPCFRDVLSKAAGEARGRGNWQVGSAHLLLALLAEKDSVGYRVLKALGLSSETVRKAIMARQGESRDRRAACSE